MGAVILSMLRFPALLFFLALCMPAQNKTQVFLGSFGNDGLKAKIELNVSILLTQMNSAAFLKNEPAWDSMVLTEKGELTLKSLWGNAPLRCLETEIRTSLIRRPDYNYEIRGIPITINRADDSLQIEEGVLIITPAGKVEDLYYGLETQQYNRILTSSENETDQRRRKVILDFVENFRTAYNRKDITFLEDVFSDNALIIVGKVIQVDKASSDMLNLIQDKSIVQLVRYSKKEYLSNLRKTFKVNSYIKVGFDNIDIMRHRVKSYLYGIQLKQKWASTGYKDTGYLFLLIDFRDELKPIVHVRAWQPEQFTKKEEAINLGFFEFE